MGDKQKTTFLAGLAAPFGALKGLGRKKPALAAATVTSAPARPGLKDPLGALKAKLKAIPAALKGRDKATGEQAAEVRVVEATSAARKEPRPLPLLGKLSRGRQMAITGGAALAFIAIAGSVFLYANSRSSDLKALSDQASQALTGVQRLSRELQLIGSNETRLTDNATGTASAVGALIKELASGSGNGSLSYNAELAEKAPLYSDGASSREMISAHYYDLDKTWNEKIVPQMEALSPATGPLHRVALLVTEVTSSSQALRSRLDNLYVVAIQLGMPAEQWVALGEAQRALSAVDAAVSGALSNPRASGRSMQSVRADMKVIAKAVSQINRSYQTSGLRSEALGRYVSAVAQQANEHVAALEELLFFMRPTLSAKNAAVTALASMDQAYVSLLSLRTVYDDEVAALRPYFALAAVLGLASLASLLLMFAALGRDSQRQAWLSDREYKTTEDSIRDFFQVMRQATRGNLTVQAQVRETLTGTISDAFNMMLGKFRTLIGNLGKGVSNVSQQAAGANALAGNVSAVAEKQLNEVGSATRSVSSMAESARKVSVIVRAAAEQSKSSVEVVRSGNAAVAQTLSSMETISQSQQDALKLIKRVAERSQEVGEINTVLTSIYEQIRVLSLNAKVEALRAGDAGTGFGVVAEEIQRLAKRVDSSLLRIGKTVSATVSDTNEAVAAVDRTVAAVVEGSKVAREARDALGIVNAEHEKLTQMVTTVDQLAAKQLREAEEARARMHEVEELAKAARQSAVDMKESTNSIADTTKQLTKSISVFKTTEDSGTGKFPAMATAAD